MDKSLNILNPIILDYYQPYLNSYDEYVNNKIIFAIINNKL